MKTVIHSDFEPEDKFFKNDTDEEIRKFSKFTSDRLPDHISSFVLIVTRDGYVTNAIPKNGKNEKENQND